MTSTRTNCGIYRIINLVPNETTGISKVYAGSSGNLKSRKYVHFYNLENNKHENSYLQNAYNKIKELHGKDNAKRYFKFIPILYLEKIEDKIKLKEILLEHENLELSKYKKDDGSIDHDKCYNIRTTAESNLGFKHTKESKLKISMASTKQWAGTNYKNRLNKNKKVTKHTEESKLKISIAHKGRKHTEESKQNMRNGHKGITFSKNCRESRIQSQKRKIKNIDTNEVFESIKEAIEYYSLSRGNITSALKGNTKTAGGYRWTYIV